MTQPPDLSQLFGVPQPVEPQQATPSPPPLSNLFSSPVETPDEAPTPTNPERIDTVDEEARQPIDPAAENPAERPGPTSAPLTPRVHALPLALAEALGPQTPTPEPTSRQSGMVGSGWVRPDERATDEPLSVPIDYSVTASPFYHGEAVAAPREGDAPGTPHLDEGKNASERRYVDADRLWPIVDDILLVTGTDPILQDRTAKLEFTRDSMVDAAQRAEFLEVLKPRLAAGGIRIPDQWDVPALLAMAYDEILGISVLGDLWRDPEVTEIMVDRWDRIVIERNGRLEETNVRFRSPDHANSIARSLALRVSDRAVSQTIPLVTAELPQARVTFAYGPVVKGGLSITIRKFKPLLGLESLMSYGSLTQDMVDFLQDAVHARAGVLVSGGTGSGKTTIINLLSSFIPDNERVITIEDAFELSLTNRHVVSLQTKEAASLDDSVSVTLADLLRNTLRMRPDRIIVGEIREGEGATVMLAAANTGHDGTMTTIHANTANLAVNERFVDLVRQVRTTSNDESIRRTITAAFDLVVQVTRGRGGRRYISEISSVDEVGANGQVVLRPVFQANQAEDGKVTFERFPIDPKGSIGERLAFEKGVLSRWTGELS